MSGLVVMGIVPNELDNLSFYAIMNCVCKCCWKSNLQL